jgi:glycosyltransferase involved in cell wall biosynthesis
MTSALLISTYNWPQALELVLDSLCVQTQMPNCVIIADDGSTQETRDLILSYSQKLKIPLNHIWHADQGFRKAVILNKAIAQTSVDFIIQIDGDCIMHPHFIEDYLKAARTGCFFSGTRINIKEAYLPELWRDKVTRFHLFHPGLRNGLRALHWPVIGRLYRPKKHFSRKFRGCNTGYWRRDFLAINGYNEAFEGWGREDSDLAHRLIHLGCAMQRLKHRALVYHIPHKIRSKDQLDQNDALQKHTIDKRIVRIERGVDQYL